MTRHQADALWSVFESVPRLVELAEFAVGAHIISYSLPPTCSRSTGGTPSMQHSGAGVADGGCLVSAFGNGPTPEDAMRDYAGKISERRVVVDAPNPCRKEIQVPRLSGLRKMSYEGVKSC